MKYYMKWLVGFSLIVFCIGLFGRLILFANNSWNFLFENLTWLPMEVLTTVFFVDKIIAERDKYRDRQKFIKLTRKANTDLINSPRENLDGFNENNYYFKKSSSTQKDCKISFKHLARKLLLWKDTIRFNDNPGIMLDYGDFSKNFFQKMFDTVQRYLDRYILYIDDDLLDKISEIQDKCLRLGKLDNPEVQHFVTVYHTGGDNVKDDTHTLEILINQLEAQFKKLAN